MYTGLCAIKTIV